MSAHDPDAIRILEPNSILLHQLLECTVLPHPAGSENRLLQNLHQQQLRLTTRSTQNFPPTATIERLQTTIGHPFLPTFLRLVIQVHCIIPGVRIPPCTTLVAHHHRRQRFFLMPPRLHYGVPDHWCKVGDKNLRQRNLHGVCLETMICCCKEIFWKVIMRTVPTLVDGQNSNSNLGNPQPLLLLLVPFPCARPQELLEKEEIRPSRAQLEQQLRNHPILLRLHHSQADHDTQGNSSIVPSLVVIIRSYCFRFASELSELE